MEPIRLELANPPLIGVTASGQEIRMGGFSGLRFLGRTPSGLYRFVTHTDRGPNADEIPVARGQERPFGLPAFRPRLVFLEADLRLRRLFVSQEVPLSLADGKPVSGRPPEEGSEVAVDFHRQPLPADNEGLDLEGITVAEDGSFWLCDEYAPGLVRFSADGVLLEKVLPGRGLPESFRHRRPNRGFEAIGLLDGKIIAALESPLDNPPSREHRNSRNSRLTRFVELDLRRKIASAQYAYLLEEPDHGRVSDLCFEGPGQLLVIEKGKSFGKEWKRLYRASFAGATNLQRLSSTISGPGGTLESLLPKELVAHGVVPMKKTLMLDLTALGMKEEKFEGVDRVDEKFIALVTDNDFGLAGGLDHENAVAELKHEPPALYFVPLLKG